jgi:oligosaccharide repeat unit polymerase
LAIAIIGFPFYVQKAYTAWQFSGINDFLQGVRQQALDSEAAGSFDLLENVALLAILLAPIVLLEDDGTWKRRMRTVLAVSLALAYGALSGSKGAYVHVPLILLAVQWLKAGRPRLWVFVSIATICVFLFVAGIISVNLAYLNVYGPLDLTSSAIDLVPNYTLGSLVAFDRLLTGEVTVENTQGIFRGIKGVARNLGAKIDLPSIHLDYANISNYEDTNTYTAYFSYIEDLGLLGTAGWMVVLGVIVTYFYRAAMARDPLLIIVYAMVVDGIVFSIQAEHLVLAVSQFVKTVLILFVLYRMPLIRFR